MSADWGSALRVGAMGFSMVFVILTALYVILKLIGRLGSGASRAKVQTSNPDGKK
ncbi:MAG: hypothetical protein V1894_02565 [Chloroflexota bacterium]